MKLSILEMYDQARFLAGQEHQFETTNLNVAEKFAELIVQECLELTRWKEFDMSVEQRIRLSVYQDIKEHFGVE